MMDKQAMMQDFVSSAITPLLERVVTKKLVQVFDVIAEDQKARLATLEAENKALREALEKDNEHLLKVNADLQKQASTVETALRDCLNALRLARRERCPAAQRAAALLEKK